ncbi:tRNA-dihydrouridine synthase [Saccharicrinis sp. GN24d3]|uniref:tRNA-dihydrouridine synthase n=1 Tax=Saccharicrinis sp. GN24d3 TaxID=3458416 RepID=UPI004036B9B3
MNTSIYLAPLQSFTTLPYCLAFENVVGGVDKYFTPFYRTDKDGTFSFEKYLFYRPPFHIVPQVLTNSAGELILFANNMQERGFEEINLNLGCPFPMVVNRKLGSGLLPFPNRLDTMLSVFFNENMPVKLSVKLRLGLKDKEDIYRVMNVLNQYPLEEIIIHPRLGIQQYSGKPDWDIFAECSKQHRLVGNGDIVSLDGLEVLKQRFRNVDAWMIGRGLLMNPCMLKPQLDWKETMVNMHELFLDNLRIFGFSEHQILNQLKCFWEYPSQYLEGGRRVFRKLKKTGSLEDYEVLKKKLLGLY